MLHKHHLLRDELSGSIFFATIAVIALAALGAAGLRGSDGTNDPAIEGDGATPVAQAPADANAKAIKSRVDLTNLKQLALAMHNYHDRYQHFPPAVVMGADGKTPHSWRVELLPELGQQALYERYRMNEPWDSPFNKEVLAQMPECFRDPFDNPKSTNSGYYVLVGPGAAFEGSEGIKISDFTDGTSNTILIVEANRGIPWSKPEDISFDPGKERHRYQPFGPSNPPPTLGGFIPGHFAAALADGSARIFDTDKIKDQLKWLIMRNDGAVVDWQKIEPPAKMRHGTRTAPPGCPQRQRI